MFFFHYVCNIWEKGMYLTKKNIRKYNLLQSVFTHHSKDSTNKFIIIKYPYCFPYTVEPPNNEIE